MFPDTNTLWFDIAVVTLFFLLGHIYFGHFEERSPKWRKVLKYIVTMAIVLTISVYAGRVYAFGLLALGLIPVIYIHGVLLPRKGINGWTGEPKGKYYDFRGWSKDIFKELN
jgi:asparagine N-glycosylation enzyme membrane subunit Stt3